MFRRRCRLIRAKIDDELEQKFRELAMKRFGYSKGSLSRAVVEAIQKWTSEAERYEVTFGEDPVEALSGMLSDIEIDSVELQHKIKDLWVLKLAENLPS